MLTRPWAIVIVVFSLFAPSSVRAQVVEEDDTEILKPITETNEPAKRPDPAQAAKRILNRVNQFPDEKKREKGEWNPTLGKAAQYFADYMARTNRYGHKADSTTPADRAKKFGYEYCIVAENIAYAYSSGGFTTQELVKEFFDGWKVSPGHRKN